MSHLLNFLTGVALAATLVGCSSKAATPEKVASADETAIPVTLVQPEPVNRPQPVEAAGLLASEREARLSFKIGGIIRQLLVEEGQRVRKGQLLATLDLTEIDAQVQQAELGAAKSDRDFNRVSALLRDTAATLEQVQNATTGRDVARQQLAIARFNRQYAEIRATVDGTVTKRFVNAGELVNPGAPVFQITSAQAADWVVRVGVADKDWARLQLGDSATVRLDAYPRQTFRGTVSQLAEGNDPMTRLYEVEIKVRPGAARFATGLFARVALHPRQQARYVAVPVESIVEGNGRDGFVYTLADDQKHVRKQPIKIGYLDGARVFLTDGASPTQPVVLAGSAFLTEQATVVVR